MENVCAECECVWLVSSWCNVANIHWLCSSTSCTQSQRIRLHIQHQTIIKESASVISLVITTLCLKENKRMKLLVIISAKVEINET